MNFRNFECGPAYFGPWRLVVGAVAAFGLLGSSGAMAQSCAPLTLTSGPNTISGSTAVMASGLSAANAVSGAVQAANTAFLTQSTAFVSAPGNAPANSEGSGMWIRG